MTLLMEPLEPNQVIAGRYRLIEQVGAGGAATVWRATHDALGRSVAIKFLSSRGPISERKAARFLREARTAASVHHRFVVDLIDFGTSDNGQPFMVMEHLVGETLGERLARAPAMALPELLQTLCDCLTGLDAVHRAGVVHRDLKPDNIFLVLDGGKLVPKLLDFGISRTDDPTELGPQGEPLTADGAILGTPWYMAPEQVRSSRDADARSDLYSVGVILYEALSGSLPFDASDITALLLQVVAEAPLPITAIREDVPLSLSGVVSQALSKEPKDRFATAIELREAIAAIRDETNGMFAAVLARRDSGCSLASPTASEPSPFLQPGVRDATPTQSEPTLSSARHSRLRWSGIAITTIAVVAGGIAATVAIPTFRDTNASRLAVEAPTDRREASIRPLPETADAGPPSLLHPSVSTATTTPASPRNDRTESAAPRSGQGPHRHNAQRPGKRRRTRPHPLADQPSPPRRVGDATMLDTTRQLPPEFVETPGF